VKKSGEKNFVAEMVLLVVLVLLWATADATELRGEEAHSVPFRARMMM
jgi:hypothetical protein